MIPLLSVTRDPHHYISMDTLQGDTIVGDMLNGTVVGNPPLVDGVNGKAISLTQYPQAITLGSMRDECAGNLEICEDGFTLAFWIKMEVNLSLSNKFVTHKHVYLFLLTNMEECMFWLLID